MFGDKQMAALADYIQAALMLKSKGCARNCTQAFENGSRYISLALWSEPAARTFTVPQIWFVRVVP